MRRLAPQESLKRRPEPTELLPEQARQAAKPQKQAGRLPRTLTALVQTKLPVRLALRKNSVRPPRSLRAWAASGIEVQWKRQAFRPGAMSSPA